ncbi:MAG: hypothetical protein ACRDZW_00075, partial [Acidimicrobiales bacterium]
AWDGFRQKPLAGNGFGSYESFSESVVDLTQPLVVGGVTYSAHSVPLQILYEWGLAGLLLAAWASWLVVRRCWNAVLAPVAVAAAVVAVFETFQYVVQVSWVAGLALAIGLNFRLTAAAAARTMPPQDALAIWATRWNERPSNSPTSR